MQTWLFVLGSRFQTVADGEERGGPEAHEDAKTLSMSFVLTLLVVPYGNTGSDGCEAGRIGHSRSEAESTKTFDHDLNRNLGVDITWSSSVVVSGHQDRRRRRPTIVSHVPAMMSNAPSMVTMGDELLPVGANPAVDVVTLEFASCAS